MTQQERPRTSRSHYGRNIHEATPTVTVDSPSSSVIIDQEIEIPRYNYADRPKSRRSARRPPLVVQAEAVPPTSNPPASPVDQIEAEIPKQQFIPRPPMMPQREETFIHNHNSNNNVISPRRRRYSAVKRGEPVIENNQDHFYENSYVNMENDSGSMRKYSQSTLTRKPSSQQSTKPVIMNFSTPKDPIEIIASETPDRPVSSRLSRFSAPLPPISNYGMANSSSNSVLVNDFNRQLSLQPSSQQQKVRLSPRDANSDLEPDEGATDSVMIAIRLPNGETLKRNFSKTDSMLSIIKFASKKSNINFLEQDIKLLEMPRRTIEDFKQTIEFYGLQNRTMLHIIYKT